MKKISKFKILKTDYFQLWIRNKSAFLQQENISELSDLNTFQTVSSTLIRLWFRGENKKRNEMKERRV